QVVPGRALEDTLLLDSVLLGIGIDAERHLADAIRRPGNRLFERHILHGHGYPPGAERMRQYALAAGPSSSHPLLPQQAPCDDDAHDFVGAFEDLVNADV